MLFRLYTYGFGLWLATLPWSAALSQEAAPKEPPPKSAPIDFRKDVAPILQQHCLDCHNPELHMAELRLDQRQFVVEDDGRGLIKPEKSADSLLIQRLVDPKLGILMPPTFPFLPGEKAGLPAEKIEVLKAWIDQGADWPAGVSLATEAKEAGDPLTGALFAAIRAGDHAAVEKLLAESKSLVAARDKHGSTPLLHAAAYSDTRMLQALLARGADVNAASADGATALHRGAGEFEKVKVLLQAGASVDVRTTLGRTPLLVAASYPGNLESVKLLLANRADIQVQDQFQETCLTSAAKRGDAEMASFLAKAGADLTGGSRPPLVWAAEEGNVETVGCLLECGCGKVRPVVSAALGSAAARGPVKAVQLLLASGADPNAAAGFGGYTPLMLAAYSENVNGETVKLLLAAGADPNAKSPDGQTALNLAKKRGNTNVVELLQKAGAEK